MSENPKRVVRSITEMNLTIKTVLNARPWRLGELTSAKAVTTLETYRRGVPNLTPFSPKLVSEKSSLPNPRFEKKNRTLLNRSLAQGKRRRKFPSVAQAVIPNIRVCDLSPRQGTLLQENDEKGEHGKVSVGTRTVKKKRSVRPDSSYCSVEQAATSIARTNVRTKRM